MAELKFEVPEGTVEGLFSQPGGEGFRVLVEAVAQALINSQAEAHFGAPWNARGMERPNGYRNGYKPRGFQTVAGALDLSRGVLREFGNMSSPTIFFIMKRLFESGTAGHAVAMAFGPGLTIELVLLHIDRGTRT